ncbi:MAG: sporulation protein YunB [Bacilli bacterium]
MKKNKKKKNGLLITIAILISVMTMTFLFINYYSKKALPLILSYAEAETKKLTILVINKAVTKQINNMDTDELFDIAYNKDGEITLIDFNSKKTSKILSTMTSLVELNLRAVEEGKIDMLELPDNSLSDYNMNLLEKGIIVEVPLGIITNSSLLYNIGPKIPVKLSLVGDVVTGFSSEVVEYGINNALLKLMIDIKVDTKIILPIVSDQITIDCSIPIAMKVIQGKIPSYYIDGFTTKSNIVEGN